MSDSMHTEAAYRRIRNSPNYDPVKVKKNWDRFMKLLKLEEQEAREAKAKAPAQAQANHP